MATHNKPFRWDKFADDLIDCRAAYDLGLREASRKFKITHSTWCRAEQGKPLTVPQFLKLCKWMGSDPFAYMVKR